MAMPPMMPGMPPGQPDQAGAGTQPGQPPFGSSPVQVPTPDRGAQAAGLAQVSWAVRILEKSLPMLGIASPPGKDVMAALKSLSKHVPPGSTNPGVEQTALQQMMMQGKQEQPMIQALRAMGQAGGAGGAPGAGGLPGAGGPPGGMPAPPATGETQG